MNPAWSYTLAITQNTPTAMENSSAFQRTVPLNLSIGVELNRRALGLGFFCSSRYLPLEWCPERPEYVCTLSHLIYTCTAVSCIRTMCRLKIDVL
jgi:hypothetical protein